MARILSKLPAKPAALQPAPFSPSDGGPQSTIFPAPETGEAMATCQYCRKQYVDAQYAEHYRNCRVMNMAFGPIKKAKAKSASQTRENAAKGHKPGRTSQIVIGVSTKTKAKTAARRKFRADDDPEPNDDD